MTEHKLTNSSTAEAPTSTPNFMNKLRKGKVAWSIIAGAAALSLAGCSTSHTEAAPTHSHSVEHSPEAKKTPAKPEYLTAPTAEQLKALYTPLSASDEQLAQNSINVIKLMWSGTAQKNTEDEYVDLTSTQGMSPQDAHEQMANDWDTAAANDPNLFAEGTNTPGYDLIYNIDENNFTYDDFDGKALESLTYDGYETIGADTAQQRTINVKYKYVIDQSRKLTGQGAQNGQEGMWQFTYVPSADGYWSIQKIGDFSYMLNDSI